MRDWFAYAQALGPTVTASIAAVVVAVFSYRQWLVAKDKLRLDLFEKRYDLYRRLDIDFAQTGRDLTIVKDLDEEDALPSFEVARPPQPTTPFHEMVQEVFLLFGEPLGLELEALNFEAGTRLFDLLEYQHARMDTGSVCAQNREWWTERVKAFQRKLSPYMNVSHL